MTRAEALKTFSISKADNRKALEQLPYYVNSKDTELWHVYGRYSLAKNNAFCYCHNLMTALGGHDLRIVSHNLTMFSVGFMFEIEGVEAFAYITRDYNRYVLLAD